jgi:uncharacterized membrane protein HdeD (DUF308 family)
MSNSNAVCNSNEAAEVQSLVANTVRGNARLGTVSGFLLVVLGILAIATPFVSGVAASTLVSAIMIAAGMTLLFFCFKAESFGRGIGQFLLGSLTVVGGTFMLMEPVLTLFTLTGILLVWFIADGIVTIYQGIKRKPQEGWGWVVFSGVSSLVLGGLLAYDWPASGIYAVGLLVGIRLLIAGWSVAMLGMAGDTLGEGIANISEEQREALREEFEAELNEEENVEAPRAEGGNPAPQPA